MPVSQPELSILHASDPIREVVQDWFSGKIMERELDGRRSVRVPHPEKPDFWLKIKGAGFQGGAIGFGKPWNSRLKAPVFDFDGRMMEDVASGHDNAWKGGASFQQAVVEYRISRILESLGHRVVPCVGYGQIRVKGQVSWFSLMEVGRSWESVVVGECPIEEYAEANIRMGKLITDLAVHHGLVGYGWYMKTPEGEYLLKDLHPFRSANPIDMSQVSWVMQVFFALHIEALAALHFSRAAPAETVPDDLPAFPFRGFLPDATRAEHHELRWPLVARYMTGPPRKFDQRKLLEILRGNRITRTLMEMCPEEYARP